MIIGNVNQLYVTRMFDFSSVSAREQKLQIYIMFCY